MVLTLQAMVSAGGYTLVTWNGLNFDFPEPDTSWMTDPPRRDDFTRWLHV